MKVTGKEVWGLFIQSVGMALISVLVGIFW
ncbi:MAG: hypothetical protein H6Q67_1082 [Firmicutes bacterium]|nr:hypothetical protein [Bacillota bacterium]